MSLFQIQEWYSVVYPNSYAMCVARLIGSRDQLVVGTLDGILAVLDPGREPERRQEFSILAELSLKRPILQLCVGHFLPATFDEPILAALVNNALLYFRITQTAESFVCEQVFEHRVPGPPAFNMCQGHFGRSTVKHICIQSLQGHVTLFEAENRVLQHQIPDILHPGPIGYSAITESILVASGGYLSSIRYASLIATGTKQINVDWTLPLGDTAIQITVLSGIGVAADGGENGANSRQTNRVGSLAAANSSTTTSTIQPSILVLCKRVLFCITHAGDMRYTIRLQSVALCMRVLSHAKDDRIPMVIGTSAKTLLFYTDTRLVWNAQLPFVSQRVYTCTFSESLRSLLAILSDDGRLLIGYLGTEPALFRMPATETRFIDFEERKRELREFEEAIWQSSQAKSDGGDEQLTDLQISVTVDERSVSYFSTEGIPSSTVLVHFRQQHFHNQHMPADLLLNSNELHSTSGTHFVLSPDTESFSFTLFCHERMVLERRCQLLLQTQSLYFAEFTVPLSLISHEVPAKRQAVFKLSLDSTQPSVDISALFPEFFHNHEEMIGAPERTSIGFQPFFGDQNSTVSVFISTKTNRYRIQSDSTDFIYIVLSEIVERVGRVQPNARLRCPIPLQIFLAEIAKHIEAEIQCMKLEKEAARISIQMRQSETVFLSKMKVSESENENYDHTHVVNYTYRELTEILDQLNVLQQNQLSTASNNRRSLRSLLNLLKCILQLNEMILPFDGRILDGTDQILAERIAQLICGPEVDIVTEQLSAADIARQLANSCEQNGNGKLRGIEEEEEEDEDAQQVNKEEKMHRELEDLNARSEAYLEFSQLESGSLPAKQLN